VIIGCLNWFNEKPSWLAACVASMAKLCGHVVAFDGAYARWPALNHRSSPVQAETIMRTADGLGMGWTIHVPREKWWGGEVEKRAALLRAASQIGDATDWLLVLDADEVLSAAWPSDRAQLEESDLDVAEVSITDEWGGLAPIRRLFRALPDITTEQAHYVVTARKAGRKVVLRGDPEVHTEEPALYLPDIRITHRMNERDAQRQSHKERYYALAIPAEQEALEEVIS
jgi:hypothetical protein